jgi:hypothetical protein
MTQPLHTGRLVLTPVDPHALPIDLQAILERLRDIGFMSEAIAGDSPRYRLGEQFVQLVTFMGCSPFVALEPGEGDAPFCHLSILGPFDHPRLLCGRNTTPPRCEVCRKRLADWRSTIHQWRMGNATSPTACPHCGHLQDPVSYDWRESAGWGRLFLCVENIFPQEAMPTQALLNQLQGATSELPWRYFYQQEELDHPGE